MARFTNLHVWQQARELLKLVSTATADMRAEGDLKSQMRRAAISVASNIAEGSERGSSRELRRFLLFAQASNAEVEAKAIIAGGSGVPGAGDQPATGRSEPACRPDAWPVHRHAGR